MIINTSLYVFFYCLLYASDLILGSLFSQAPGHMDAFPDGDTEKIFESSKQENDPKGGGSSVADAVLNDWENVDEKRNAPDVQNTKEGEKVSEDNSSQKEENNLMNSASDSESTTEDSLEIHSDKPKDSSDGIKVPDKNIETPAEYTEHSTKGADLEFAEEEENVDSLDDIKDILRTEGESDDIHKQNSESTDDENDIFKDKILDSSAQEFLPPDNDDEKSEKKETQNQDEILLDGGNNPKEQDKTTEKDIENSFSKEEKAKGEIFDAGLILSLWFI